MLSIFLRMETDNSLFGILLTMILNQLLLWELLVPVMIIILKKQSISNNSEFNLQIQAYEQGGEH